MSATLPQVYQLFLEDAAHRYRLRPNTVRAYRYELANAAKETRFQVSLSDLNLNDIEKWIERDQASSSTISRRASTFNRFFKWAIRQGLCENNPLDGRLPIRVRRRLPRPIHKAVDRDTIDQAIGMRPQPYRLIYIILRETGMRVGEVLQLRVGDVILEPGREGLLVREAKNNTERVVVLGATATPKTIRGLRTHLKKMGQAQAHDILFRSARGTAVSYDAVHYQWHKLCTAAQLIDDHGRPQYTLHQLRHTRGSELVAQGQRIEVVQRVLGHRDIRSTLLYADLNEEQVRAALEQPITAS